MGNPLFKIMRPTFLCWVVTILFLSFDVPVKAQTKSKKKPTTAETAVAKKKVPAKKGGTGKKESAGESKSLDKKPASAVSEVKKIPGVDEAKPTVPAVQTEVIPNASITSAEIQEFQAQPAGVQKIIEFSLVLARQNLTYTFGSADPANGGMDCSGFIYYVLRQHGLTQVPRDSSGLYSWTRKARSFRAVVSRKADGFEMDELLPGDLLFWTGTYATENDPPVTHTMIYLGTEKSTGAKIMIGSSDGRTYRGQKRNGVSVFDFTMPRTPATGEQRSTFIGYARIPGLRD